MCDDTMLEERAVGSEQPPDEHFKFPAAWQCYPDSWLTLVGDDLARSKKQSYTVLLEITTYAQNFPARDYASFHVLLDQFAQTLRNKAAESRHEFLREIAVVNQSDGGWYARILYDVPKGMRRSTVLKAAVETWPCWFRYGFCPVRSWKTEAINQLHFANVGMWHRLVFSRDFENPDGIINNLRRRSERMQENSHD